MGTDDGYLSGIDERSLSSSPPMDPIHQVFTQCIICKESGKIEEFADNDSHMKLRRHVNLFHFNSYKPYRCGSCDAAFGDPKLLDCPAWCCDQFDGTSINLHTTSRDEVTEECINLVVNYSLALSTSHYSSQMLMMKVNYVIESFANVHLDPIEIDRISLPPSTPTSDSLPPSTPTANNSRPASNVSSNECTSTVSTPSRAVSSNKFTCKYCFDEDIRNASTLLNHCLNKHMGPAARGCFFCEDEKFTFIDEWKAHMKENHSANRKHQNKQKPLEEGQKIYARDFLTFLKNAGVPKGKVVTEAAVPNTIIDEIYGQDE